MIVNVWKAGSGNVYVVTIPKKVRDFYNINDGDFLDLEIKKILRTKSIDRNGTKEQIVETVQPYSDEDLFAIE